MKVIEGLKIGNECLNKMHEVRVTQRALGEAELWVFTSVLQPLYADFGFLLPGHVNRRSGKNNR